MTSFYQKHDGPTGFVDVLAISAALHPILVTNGYSVENYTSSILGRKTQGTLFSELRIHFTKAHPTRFSIDHSVLRRSVNKSAPKQVVRTVRRTTTIESFLRDIDALAKLPVCFTSLKSDVGICQVRE